MVMRENWQLGREMDYPYEGPPPDKQVAYVFDINKCIACQTCTVACKTCWTSGKGQETNFWNNVESKPYGGYPVGWDTKLLEETGAAEYLAGQVMNLLGDAGPWPVIMGLYILTAMATMIIPTAALVVLMSPIVLSATTADDHMNLSLMDRRALFEESVIQQLLQNLRTGVAELEGST